MCNASGIKYDLIIRNANLVSIASNRPLVEKNVDIAILNDKIVKIAKSLKLIAKKEIDATNMVVLPGFINLHSHLCMSVFRFTNNENFSTVQWLHKIIFPIENKIDDEICYKLARYGIIESISNGITTISDMYFKLEQINRANEDFNINLFLCKGTNDLDDGKKSLQETCNFLSISGAKNFVFGIHALYTSSPLFFDTIMNYAIKRNFRIHMHFCEEPNEAKLIKKTYRVKHCSQAFESFLPRIKRSLILAHCVVMDAYDHSIFKKYKNIINVAHCPISNMMLKTGVCDVISLLKNKVNVSVATDGQGSANSLSLLSNLRVMYYLQSANNVDTSILTPINMLKMITYNPAKALGIENERGTINIGMYADLIIFNFSNFRSFPIHDLIRNVVFNANETDICHLIINGKVLIQDYQIKSIDKKAEIAKINQVKQTLFNSIIC
jgi:5-methylthioadenosine/S-adenosylhomocysteine deaminase